MKTVDYANARRQRSAGFQTCCVADCPVGAALESSDAPRAGQPATPQTRRSALQSLLDTTVGRSQTVLAAHTRGLAERKGDAPPRHPLQPPEENNAS
jgi:hypothetical protein